MCRRLAAAMLLPLMAAAVFAASPVTPTESEWLVTTLGNFSIKGDPQGRDGRVAYDMEFGLRKPVTQTLYVTVDFENPEDKETPLFAEFELAPGATAFKARSELIPAISNRQKYLVKVWIYADVKRRQLLGTHEQLVLFQMPGDLARQLGITLL
jgi:hypothetical protein